MKKYLSILFVLVIQFILLTGCGDSIKYVPKVPDEVENFQAVKASHTISYDDVNCYVLIKNQLQDNDLLYSITVYMNFLKGERTNRLYSYYQFDYYLENDSFLYDYHLFDSIDGAYRNYSQNFMPYYNLGYKIKNFNFLVKYTYDMKNSETNKNESYEKEYSFSENIITFDNTQEYTQDFNKYIVEVNTKENKSEKYNSYKLNVSINDNIEGHIDMQAFAVSNGNIYPLYGLYHYDLSNLSNGNYSAVSDEKINSNFFEKVYVIINEYDYNNNFSTYYLEAKINRKEVQ